MKTRTLARRGIAFSELGFGASQLGNLYRETTDEEARGAVDAAWQAGIRYFDTAPHYGLGLSERRVGAALAGRPRDDYLLSTKVGRLLVPNPDAHAGRLDDEGFVVPAATVRRRDYSRDGVLRSVEASLERLGLDRIDIAYVHDPDDFVDETLRGAIPALIELREQGVLRAIGVGMNQSAAPATFVEQSDIDLVMLAGRYTLLDQRALDDLLPIAADRGVGIVAAAVFNSGLLANDTVVSDARFDYEPAPPELVARATAIAERCRAAGVSLPAAAIRFPLRHPSVLTVVLGMRTAAQVRSNIARLAAAIPDSLFSELAADGLIDPRSMTEGSA